MSTTSTTGASVAPTTSAGIGTDEGGPNSPSQSVLIMAGGAAAVVMVMVGLIATAVVIMETMRKRKKNQKTESGERKHRTNHTAATGIYFSMCVCMYMHMGAYNMCLIMHLLSCLIVS